MDDNQKQKKAVNKNKLIDSCKPQTTKNIVKKVDRDSSEDSKEKLKDSDNEIPMNPILVKRKNSRNPISTRNTSNPRNNYKSDTEDDMAKIPVTESIVLDKKRNDFKSPTMK